MRLIPITKGHTVIVDDDDFVEMSRYKWSFNEGYARRSSVHGVSYMHRVIIGAKAGQEVDHRNRNRLDNRKSNLRICTRLQNVHNYQQRKKTISGLRGVTRAHNKSRLWKAEIYFMGARKYLGCFVSKRMASQAYESMARKLHGEFYAS